MRTIAASGTIRSEFVPALRDWFEESWLFVLSLALFVAAAPPMLSSTYLATYVGVRRWRGTRLNPVRHLRIPLALAIGAAPLFLGRELYSTLQPPYEFWIDRLFGAPLDGFMASSLLILAAIVLLGPVVAGCLAAKWQHRLHSGVRGGPAFAAALLLSLSALIPGAGRIADLGMAHVANARIQDALSALAIAEARLGGFGIEPGKAEAHAVLAELRLRLIAGGPVAPLVLPRPTALSGLGSGQAPATQPDPVAPPGQRED